MKIGLNSAIFNDMRIRTNQRQSHHNHSIIGVSCVYPGKATYPHNPLALFPLSRIAISANLLQESTQSLKGVLLVEKDVLIIGAPGR